MRAPEARRVTAQRSELIEQTFRRRRGQQHRQQCVFLRARRIDGVDELGGAGLFAVEIGPQIIPGNAGGGFDCNHPLCGHAGPIGYGGLADAYFARKLSNAACGVDRAIKPVITHVDLPSKSRLLDYRFCYKAVGSVIPVPRTVNRLP